MYIHFDIFGNELNIGDYIAATSASNNKDIGVYQITKLTIAGASVNTIGGYHRNHITAPHSNCVKVSIADVEKYIGLQREYHEVSQKGYIPYSVWIQEKFKEQ